MVKNFYQPDPGPDWTKKLSEVYARQTQQREEHHRNLLQQSAELERADPGVANLALFKQILDTTATGVQVYNKFNSKEAKEKRQEDRKLEWLDKSDEFRQAAELKFDSDLKDIERGDEEGAKTLIKNIKARFGNDISAEDIDKIVQKFYDLKPSQIVKFERLALNNVVKSAGGTEGFHTHLKGTPKDENGFTEFDRLSEGGLDPNSDAYQSAHKKWIEKYIDDNAGEVSDGLKSKVYPELIRITDTAAKAKKNQAGVTYKQTQNARNYAFLSKENITTEPKALAKHFQDLVTESSHKYVQLADGTTPIQQALSEVQSNLVELGEKRLLDRDTWLKITEGLIDHPAGNNILKAFDKEGSLNTAVLNGITRGEQLEWDDQVNIGKSFLKNNYLLAQKGELNEDQYKASVIMINSLPGFEKKDQMMDDFEKAYHSNQSPEQTQANIDQYDPEVNKGNLTQDHVDSVADTKANNALQDKFNLQEKAKKRGNVKSKLDGLEGDVTNGKKGVLNLGKISTATNQVRDDIQNFYKENFYAKVYAAGKDADFEVLAAQALAETKTYMEVNGFGKKTGDVGAGKFSSNGWSGEYTLYSQSYANTKITDGYLNANVKFNKAEANLWDADIARTHEKPGYENPTDRFAKSDGLYTNGMLGHFLETGEVSDQMLYIAKKNNLNISRAIGYSINAKLNNPDDKDFAKNFNIKDFNTKDWPDQIILDKGYDRVKVLQSGGKNAKDPLQLLAQAKTRGFDSLSSNQMQRLFVYLDDENPVPNSMTQTAIKSRNDKKLEIAKKKARIKLNNELKSLPNYFGTEIDQNIDTSLPEKGEEGYTGF